MIRPTEPGDTAALIELARGMGVFKPAELVALREVLNDYLTWSVDRDLHADGGMVIVARRVYPRAAP
jgi:hypothetical protein